MEQATLEIMDGDWRHAQALTSLKVSGGTFENPDNTKGL